MFTYSPEGRLSQITRHIENILYENTTLIEEYSWDLECAASHLLGKNCSLMTQKSTTSSLNSFFDNEQKVVSFTENMCETIERQFERNSLLIRAFAKGFQSPP